MYTRRRLLRDGAAATGLSVSAATAGCLFSTDAGSARDFPAELVDTSRNITPSFLTAYTCDPPALRDGVGSDDVLPGIAVQLLSNVDNLTSDTSIDDLDRLTGQYGRSGGHSGSDLQFVRPSATHLVASGSIDVEAVSRWLSTQDGVSNLGSDRGYRRYGAGDDVPEAFVVDASALGYGTRDNVGVDSTAIATDAIDALEDASSDGGSDDGATAGSGIESYAPDLLAVVEALEGDTVSFATQFDLVAERPDTGTPAYDDVAASVLAAGVGATVDATGDGGTVDVERALRYRRGRAPSVESVEAALDRAADAGSTDDDQRPLATADWSVDRSGRTVVASATVDGRLVREHPGALRSAFPSATFEDVTEPIDPRTMGREPAPRVEWEPSLHDDGRVRIVHGGGSEVEDLVVHYDANGASIEEQWDGPVTSDDEFETEQAPDPDTLFDLVWAPGTADETILLRFELPPSS